MNCPKCNAVLQETHEERRTGRYNNVYGVIVFLNCPQCGYNTDSTEDEGVTLLANRKAEAPAPTDTATDATEDMYVLPKEWRKDLTLFEQIKAMLAQGTTNEIVKSIKFIRDQYKDVGLRDAKEYCEAIIQGRKFPVNSAVAERDEQIIVLRESLAAAQRERDDALAEVARLRAEIDEHVRARARYFTALLRIRDYDDSDDFDKFDGLRHVQGVAREALANADEPTSEIREPSQQTYMVTVDGYKLVVYQAANVWYARYYRDGYNLTTDVPVVSVNATTPNEAIRKAREALANADGA